MKICQHKDISPAQHLKIPLLDAYSKSVLLIIIHKNLSAQSYIVSPTPQNSVFGRLLSFDFSVYANKVTTSPVTDRPKTAF